MNISSLLAELGTHAGLPGVKLDDNGACRLVFDDTVALDLETHPDDSTVLLVQTVVGTVPPEERVPFYASLLKSCHGRSAEADGVLSIEPAKGEVVLWRNLNVANMDVEELADRLTAAVVAAREASARLGRAGEGLDVNVEALVEPTMPELTAMIRV